MIDGSWTVDFGYDGVPLFQEIATWKKIGNRYDNPGLYDDRILIKL